MAQFYCNPDTAANRRQRVANAKTAIRNGLRASLCKPHFFVF